MQRAGAAFFHFPFDRRCCDTRRLLVRQAPWAHRAGGEVFHRPCSVRGPRYARLGIGGFGFPLDPCWIHVGSVHGSDGRDAGNVQDRGGSTWSALTVPGQGCGCILGARNPGCGGDDETKEDDGGGHCLRRAVRGVRPRLSDQRARRGRCSPCGSACPVRGRAGGGMRGAARRSRGREARRGGGGDEAVGGRPAARRCRSRRGRCGGAHGDVVHPGGRGAVAQAVRRGVDLDRRPSGFRRAERAGEDGAGRGRRAGAGVAGRPVRVGRHVDDGRGARRAGAGHECGRGRRCGDGRRDLGDGGRGAGIGARGHRGVAEGGAVLRAAGCGRGRGPRREGGAAGGGGAAGLALGSTVGSDASREGSR